MLVRDVMTNNPKTVTPDTKLLEVASLMCMFRYSGFPVLDAEGKLVGFIAVDMVAYGPDTEDLDPAAREELLEWLRERTPDGTGVRS